MYTCVMARHGARIVLSNKEQEVIEQYVRAHKSEQRLVQRAKIILSLGEGKPGKQVALEQDVRPATVSKWRKRYARNGLKGLDDGQRSGKPVQYGEAFRKQILETLEFPPPKGQACWDGPSLGGYFKTSDDAIWRVLRKEGICLSRQRSWCVSTDPEFSAKAGDIVGLYLNPPDKALVISVDEKPSIQALERRTGYVKTDSGKIVRGYKSTYKRNGTLNLFAALEVATGTVHGKTTKQKRRVDFLAFMDELLAELPMGQEIHVILDNYCIHKRCEKWLSEHPNVTFHYTPTSASWLNQIEIWFGIFSRKALKGASFQDTGQLKQAIEEFIETYNPNATPFVWRKREVRGSQLKNTIANLYN